MASNQGKPQADRAQFPNDLGAVQRKNLPSTNGPQRGNVHWLSGGYWRQRHFLNLPDTDAVFLVAGTQPGDEGMHSDIILS